MKMNVYVMHTLDDYAEFQTAAANGRFDGEDYGCILLYEDLAKAAETDVMSTAVENYFTKPDHEFIQGLVANASKLLTVAVENKSINFLNALLTIPPVKFMMAKYPEVCSFIKNANEMIGDTPDSQRSLLYVHNFKNGQKRRNPDAASSSEALEGHVSQGPSKKAKYQ